MLLLGAKFWLDFQRALIEFLIEHWISNDAPLYIRNKIIYRNYNKCYEYEASAEQVVKTINYNLLNLYMLVVSLHVKLNWSSKFETCIIYLTFGVILIKNILTLTGSGTKTCTQKHTKLAKNSNISSFGLFCTKLRPQTHRKSVGIIKKTNVPPLSSLAHRIA